MANQIIVPERRIEIANGQYELSERGKSRRGFVNMGLLGLVGVGVLAVNIGLPLLEEAVSVIGDFDITNNEVYAQGKNGKKTKLKWKDYRNPKKATITYDPETDRTLSKEFLEWDMKGYGSPILKDEPDLPQKILEIGEELKIDLCVVVAHFKLHGKYGNGIDDGKLRYGIKGRQFIKGNSWAEGLQNSWKPFSNCISFSDIVSSIDFIKPLCTLATQMQMLDEMLDKKTKEGREYNIKLWKPLWDAVKKNVK